MNSRTGITGKMIQKEDKPASSKKPGGREGHRPRAAKGRGTDRYKMGKRIHHRQQKQAKRDLHKREVEAKRQQAA